MRYEPVAFVMPWEAEEPGARAARRIRGTEAENRKHGATLSYTHGVLPFGPVSQAKGDLEFARAIGVYDSIRKHGYRRHNSVGGDIIGSILVSDVGVRILIESGHHRIAALAALGVKKVPVRMSPFLVRRAEVESWPNVRRGLFTVDAALDVFDRIFSGSRTDSSLGYIILIRPGESRQSRIIMCIRFGCR